LVSRNIRFASTFEDAETAEDILMRTLVFDKNKYDLFMNDPNNLRVVLNFDAGQEIIGRGVEKISEGNFVDYLAKKATFIIKRDSPGSVPYLDSVALNQ
jgi:hypothetical protein